MSVKWKQRGEARYGLSATAIQLHSIVSNREAKLFITMLITSATPVTSGP